MEENGIEKSNRGGRRAGAGRKPKTEGARNVRASFMLSEAAAAALERYAAERGESRNAALNALLEGLN